MEHYYPRSKSESRLKSTLQVHTLKKNSSGRVIIVGDIHGCLEQFDELLDKVQFRKDIDTLVLVGDLVNKGPDSVGVVKRAIELNAKGVIGNHDHYVLEKYEMLRHGDEDPDSSDPMVQIARELPTDCFDYLVSLPHILEIPQYKLLVIHAGIDPALHPIRGQKLWTVLHIRRVLQDGSCTDEGMIGTPWASLWKGPETIVFGHDARTGLQKHPYALGLDTGCVYGSELTAAVYPGAELVQVPGFQKYTKKPSKTPTKSPGTLYYGTSAGQAQTSAVTDLLAKMGIRPHKAVSSPEPFISSPSPSVEIPSPLVATSSQGLLTPKQIEMLTKMNASKPVATTQGHGGVDLAQFARDNSLEVRRPSSPQPAKSTVSSGSSRASTPPRPRYGSAEQVTPPTVRVANGNAPVLLEQPSGATSEAASSVVNDIRAHALRVVVATKSASTIMALLNGEPFAAMRDDILEDATISDTVFVEMVNALLADLQDNADEKLMWIRDIVITRDEVRRRTAAVAQMLLTKYSSSRGQSILLRSVLSAFRG